MSNPSKINAASIGSSSRVDCLKFSVKARKNGRSISNGIAWATDKEVDGAVEKAWEDVFEEDVET